MQKNNKPGRIIKGTAKQPTLKNASGVWTLDEALQAHRANAWPQPNLLQPIPKSLRIKQQSTSLPGYITRPITRDGDRYRFTVSMWVKIGNITAPSGSIRSLFEGFTGTSNSYFLIYITSGNQLYIGRDDNASPSGSTATWAGVLRDTNAWQHIVVACDTLQSSDANKIKLYINGVQQTLGGSFPTQGYATTMNCVKDRNNSSILNNYGPGIRIGSRWNTTFDQNFDGEVAEVNFVDGFSLPASLFGQTDTNGVWIPKAYVGSYGTNGFYLPFTNNSNSQTLGYDYSNFTTYDDDKDPYRSSVSLHLTGNGPAGGQNNTFADSSTSNFAITRSGSPTQGSSSPFAFDYSVPYNPATHGASAYFNSGTSDNLQLSATAGDLGSGDWTVECWWKSDGSQSSYSCIIGQGFTGSPSNGAWIFKVNNNGGAVFNFSYYNSGISDNSSGITVNDNAWHHLAASRSGTSLRLFVDGVLGTTISLPAGFTFGGTGATTYVGYNPRDNTYIKGNVCGLRIVKSAIYTSTFKPPRRPYGTSTTNLISVSEDFTNSSWNTDAVTKTYGYLAPDGSGTATLITPTTSDGKTSSTVTLPSTGNYTYSVWLRTDAPFTTQILFYENSNGTYSSTNCNVTNTWTRFSVTRNCTTTNMQCYVGGASSLGTPNSVYAWGAQVEAGTSVGTYIPTPENYSTAPSLLLNFANAAVVDSAGASNLLTSGSSTITSSSKYGSGALTLNGSTDYVSFTDGGLSYTFGSNNFTAEFWVYFNSVAATQCVASSANSAGSDSTSPLGWTIRSNGVLGWEGYYGSVSFYGTAATPTATVAANTWYHVATVRNNGEIIAFLNGRIVGRVSVGNASMATPVGALYIGRAGQYNGQYFNGLVDDFRVTKGVARYTSDFTPPSRALPEIGGKSFVTNNINAGVVRSFTTTGSTSWTAPSDVTQVEVLVVAGGGGGANYNSAGGGGAGGLIYNNSYPVTPNQTYTVTVGAGGQGGIGSGGAQLATDAATSGSNSVFGALVAIGGGNGGQGNVQGSRSSDQNPGVGGSGGGARGASSPSNTGAAGTAGQGFAGGNSGNYDTNYPGGGGGGAGGAGGAGVGSTTAGNGGVGLQFGISGAPTYYAGGGGGSTQGTGTTTSGGLGGGGAGGGGTGGTFINGVAGTANTGGGGGAGGYNGSTGVGGAGGSGIVILRYTTAYEASSTTDDSVVDSPTGYGHDLQAGGEVIGNYCTLNPLNKNSNVTVSNGNLTFTGAGVNQGITGTIGVSSGQWYYEASLVSIDGTAPMVGFVNNQTGWDLSYVGNFNGGYAYSASGVTYYNGGSAAYGSSYTVRDIIGVALDLTAGTLTFYKNGVSQGIAFSGLSGTFWPAMSAQTNTINVNFGQRPWVYAPPAGYRALTTKNLVRPTPAVPNQYIKAVTWTGTGATQTVTTGFKPDMIWCKTRSNDANYPIIQNTVKGITYSYGTNASDAPGNYSAVASVSSTGFTLGTTDDSNKNGDSYIGYAFRAGGNSNTFNIDDTGYATASAAGLTGGTITPTGASVSTVAGFSIIKYNGDGNVSATISHGLGRAPAMIWTKVQNGTDLTRVWHTGLFQGSDATGYLAKLSVTTAPAYDSQRPTGGTTSTFRIIGNAAPYINASGYEYIALVWAEVPGFSKFGTYTANASTDGPFVYCGFKPAWVMVKNVTRDAGNWVVLDNALNTYNPTDYAFFPNSSARPAQTYYQDFVSNGFKLRIGSGSVMNNTAGDTYIFAAFAEVPFANNNTTAR